MTARKSLEELFDLVFGAEDLRRFVDRGLDRPDSEAIGNQIQWERSESPNLASRVVEALDLHGAVDDALFDRLRVAFPERALEIEEVARQWLPGRVASKSGAERTAPPVSCAVPKGGAWDLFLAHAGPDGAAADQLYEILVEEGLSVFLDSRCLRLGARWDDVVPAALAGASMVVVLVSQRTRDAYYAREEIALAIAVSRRPDSSSRVVPVYLDRLPDDPADRLYGLQRLHGLVADDAGWPQGVASRIFDCLSRDTRSDLGGWAVPAGAVAEPCRAADMVIPAPATANLPAPGEPTPETLMRIRDLLIGLPGWDRARRRHSFVAGALGKRHRVMGEVEWEGGARQLAWDVPSACEDYPEPTATGLSPLCALLAAIPAEFGPQPERDRQVAALRTLLRCPAPGRQRDRDSREYP